SWTALGSGTVVEVLGVWAKHHHTPTEWLPFYYTYLVALAFVPAVVLFRRISPLVNWRAFTVTALYVIVTSMVWEPILALPRSWWWYQERAMVGTWVEVFTRVSTRRLPIEAVLVWVAAPFSVILTYETVKAWQYKGRPNKRVFGRCPTRP